MKRKNEFKFWRIPVSYKNENKCVNRVSRLVVGALLALSAVSAGAQITPSADSYTSTAQGSTNFGAKTLLDVQSATQTSYIQFDLSSIPSGYTGSNIAKASLKLYVNAVTTAGSLNVDFVNGSWAENTITADLAPALGTTIAASVPLAKTNAKDYILIDITPAVVAWLNGTQANDGIALVGNSPINVNFDSKESTTTSHPPELDIVFAGGGGSGITGVLTGSSSGLTGGGTSGTLNLSLLTSCGKNQILAWNGSSWACSSAGAGTITGVTAGADLTGGGTGGNITLNLDTTKVPQLAAANTFAASQQINGSLTIAKGLNVTGDSFIGTSDGLAGLQVTQGNTSGSGAIVGISQSGANASATILGSARSSTGTVFGVEGLTQSAGGAGLFGVVGTESTTGTQYGGSAGVWADSGNLGGKAIVATSDNSAGVDAFVNNTVHEAIGGYSLATSNSGGFNGAGAGVVGGSSSPNGYGVIGFDPTTSSTFQNNSNAEAIGVGGDTSSVGGAGVMGTADEGYAVFGLNNGSYVTGLFFNNSNSTSYALEAGTLSNHCTVDTSGDLQCSGTVSGAVRGQGDRMVRLYAVQSPDNWFEDFGSGTLSGGSATVNLDPGFAQTVNTSVDYHVFITPNGESEGLYVVNKTGGGFEVREQHGGHSNIGFDYRIVCRRKGYENVRLEDLTEKNAQLAAQNQKLMKVNDPASREQLQKHLHPQPHAALGGSVARATSQRAGARQNKATLTQ
jgi:hypothetical protein